MIIASGLPFELPCRAEEISIIFRRWARMCIINANEDPPLSGSHARLGPN